MPSLLDFIFGSIFLRLFSQLASPDPDFSSPRCSESTIFQKMPFEVNIDLYSDFRSEMFLFSIPKYIKIVSKFDLKNPSCFRMLFAWIFTHFGSIFEANLVPCWPLFRSEWGDRVRNARSFCLVYVIFHLFWSTRPRLGAFWARFGKIWGSVLKFLVPIHSQFSNFFEIFSNKVDSRLLGVGGMGEAFLDS